MDHSTHTQLVDSELNEANLLDAVVYGADDEKIGTVAHVHGMGAATQVIVDVGGFLGIGAAVEGMRPIVELMFADFFGVCMDQIYNHMAKIHYESGGNVQVPMVLMTAVGASDWSVARVFRALVSGKAAPEELAGLADLETLTPRLRAKAAARR